MSEFHRTSLINMTPLWLLCLLGMCALWSCSEKGRWDILSAQFRAAAYPVSYDGNGLTAGSAPVDTNQYKEGMTITVAAPGSMARSDFPFLGWNSSPDGTGADYAPGATFTMGPSNIVLYAKWLWRYRVKISFDNSGQSEDLVNFPVLVKLSNDSPIYSNLASAAGDDIRFFDGAGSPELPYEIEEIDTNGLTFIWVRVPRIDALSTNDFIWMYFGGSNATPKSSGPSVFPPSEYNIVVHFSRDANGSNASIDFGNYAAGNEPTLYDSTGQYPLTWKFSATNQPVPTATEGFHTTNSLIGKGVRGAPSPLRKTVFMSSMDTTQDFSTGTYSAFVFYQPTGSPDSFRRFIDNQGTGTRYIRWGVHNWRAPFSQFGWDGNYELANTGLAANNWYFLALAWDASNPFAGWQFEYYAQGTNDKAGTNWTHVLTNDTVPGSLYTFIGRDTTQSATDSRHMAGIVDELRWYKTKKSAAWIRADYLNSVGTNGFCAVGNLEIRP